jgi:PAS domain S-box-containing protein
MNQRALTDVSALAPDASAPIARAGSDDRAHVVQFYEDDRFLLDEVMQLVGAGLGAGDAVVVIATRAHLDGIEAGLKPRGVDTAVAREQGRYIALDAAETLAMFLVDGTPDEARFADVVGGAIAAAIERHGHVRAFGEMVALLWQEGKREAALRLERLWNDLGRKHAFSLLCGYPMSAFRAGGDQAGLREICEAHSHVVPAESYMGLTTDDERMRSITQFQQKALALEAETRERQQQERRAEEAQARLAAIIESSDDAIISKTLDGVVTSWNRGAERLFGYRAEEMIGEPIARLVPTDLRDDLPPILAKLRNGERIDHFETERVRKDGQRIHVSLTISPIKDRSGRVIGASKIARDVTERRSADRAKDEFLAMLGHELRNPLAAVQSAIIAARLDGSRRDEALEIARRQAVQLRHLVDDLLDVARVTRGKIALRKRRLFLTSVVERAVEAARTQIQERGHALSISLSPEIVVDADASRLEQVLVNLLTNAAKYTPPGGRIEVIAEAMGGEVALCVRDDGIGIDPEMLPHVFDLFSQADRSLDRAQGGLGLGLALVSRLVELHGGRVEARSAGCGQGAEFVAYLPAAEGREPDAGADNRTDAAQATTARVLLVEDNVDAADALGMLLELLGHEVRVVHDGLAALEAVGRTSPDVMLIDIGLPGIDGFEVARRVRVLPNGRSMLLVALTGYGRDEDKERAEAAGFNHHLTKPVEVDALQGLVAAMIRGSASEKPTTLQ